MAGSLATAACCCHEQLERRERVHVDARVDQEATEVCEGEAGTAASGEAIPSHNHAAAELSARHVTAEVDVPQGDQDVVAN